MSSDDDHIIDTVVLLYFLLAEQGGLLCALLGQPLQVPFAVYDPEDRTLTTDSLLRSDLLSEMRQAVKHLQNAAESGTGDTEPLLNVRRVDSLYDEGSLVTVAMTREEQLLAARLQSVDVANYGIRMPLGPGAAGCVAISLERGWTIATDDPDAFKALDKLHGNRNYDYERIRKLLIRAADEGHATRDEANAIHARMRSQGFWGFPTTLSLIRAGR